ncbi:hypothetical protein SAMN04488085_105172 [Geodermatophilus ruber]|uniref:Uncharacterized protein n=1 Tax=Geodermatophilus ruber TaxID=504800 RepID=A0A1I4E4L4_9ACTN|nr:hypothetical protein SAMN04488085_105172 [Geodermatophilus ruber]
MRVVLPAYDSRGCVEPLVGLAVRLRALVSSGWADLALTDDRADCLAVAEVDQQALFGRVADPGIGAVSRERP